MHFLLKKRRALFLCSTLSISPPRFLTFLFICNVTPPLFFRNNDPLFLPKKAGEKTPHKHPFPSPSAPFPSNHPWVEWLYHFPCYPSIQPSVQGVCCICLTVARPGTSMLVSKACYRTPFVSDSFVCTLLFILQKKKQNKRFFSIEETTLDKTPSLV